MMRKTPIITYNIGIEINKDICIINYTRDILTISIWVTLEQLSTLYQSNPSDINLSLIKRLINDSRIKHKKIYSFNSQVIEWDNDLFSFKKEDDLIICFNKNDINDYIYLNPIDEEPMSIEAYDKLKAIRSEEQKKLLINSKNLDKTMGLFDGFLK